MHSLLHFSVCLIVLVLGIGRVQASLVGIGPWPTDSSSPPMNLYTIDESTGAATFLSATDVARIQGLTVGPSGELIGLAGPRIHEIDPLTGSTSIIAELPFNSLEGGTAFQPGTNNLFVVNSGFGLNPEGLYVYDLLNGTGGMVGSFGFGSDQDISAAAFDLSGVLYILHSDPFLSATLMVATVDVNTGTATTLFDTGITNTGVAGMVFDESGQGYFTNGDNLYSFDTSASSATLIGATGPPGRISGLAIVADAAAVPEPATLLLTSLGMLGMGVLNRRRHNRIIESR